MQANRKKRLWWILSILVAATLAVALIIYALGQNINAYYTPSQLLDNSEAKTKTMRLGGMVKKGSVQHATEGLQVSFVLTDYKHEVSVEYEGLLPALFREGQGIIVQGTFQSDIFQANEVLAKHDENYMPNTL